VSKNGCGVEVTGLVAQMFVGRISEPQLSAGRLDLGRFEWSGDSGIALRKILSRVFCFSGTGRIVASTISISPDTPHTLCDL